MPDKIKNLYQEVILKHNNHPLNFVKREDAQYCLEAYNPVCGDQFKIYFDIEHERLVKLSFHGYGCAISKSSVSILTELMNNKTVGEAILINDQFNNALTSDEGVDFPSPLMAFMPVKEHPGRLKCVTLGWETLSEFLDTIE